MFNLVYWNTQIKKCIFKRSVKMLSTNYLDKTTSYYLELIEVLYAENTHTTLENLSLKLNKSKKNISSAIEQLRRYDTNEKNFILYRKNVGYSFNGSKVDFLEMRLKIIESSYVFYILKNLTLSNNLSIEDVSYKYHISESSVRNQIKKLNMILSKIDLKIKTKSRKLFLLGPELQIRYFSYQFFWNVYKGLNWPFDYIDYKKLRENVTKTMFEVFPNLTVSDTILNAWLYTFSINIIRYNLKNTFSINEIPDFLISINKDLFSPNIFNCNLVKIYRLPNEEVHFLLILLQTRARFYLIPNILNNSILLHKKMDTIYYKIDKYFESINKIATNKNDYDIILGKSILLATNLTATLFKGFSFNFNGYDIESYFNFISPQLLYNIESLIRRLCIKFPSAEFLNQRNYLLVRYAEVYALLYSPTDFEKKINVYIETDMHFALAALFIKHMKSIFSFYSNIHFYSNIDIEKNDVLPDLIVTLTDSNLISNENKKIILNSPFKEDDILLLSKKIFQIASSID